MAGERFWSCCCWRSARTCTTDKSRSQSGRRSCENTSYTRVWLVIRGSRSWSLISRLMSRVLGLPARRCSSWRASLSRFSDPSAREGLFSRRPPPAAIRPPVLHAAPLGIPMLRALGEAVCQYLSASVCARCAPLLTVLREVREGHPGDYHSGRHQGGADH